MSALRVGARVDIPDLPGRWTVWSPAADGPGCYFAVPESGGGYAVIRAVQKRGQPHPIITLVRREDPKP